METRRESAPAQSDTPEDICFATLTPDNEAAIEDFSSVCDELFHQQNVNVSDDVRRHQRQFVHVEDSKRALKDILGVTEVSYSSSEGSVNEAEADTFYWTGSYVFHLSIKPRRPDLGWFIGLGKQFNQSKKSDDDLRIHGNARTNYGRFNFDRNGSFYLEAYHRGINVGDRTLLRGERMILSWESAISFGNLRYRFQVKITPEQDTHFQPVKAAYLISNQIASAAPIEALSVTPRPSDMKVGKWIIKGGLGAGVSGIVDAAVREDGRASAAIKVFVRANRGSAASCTRQVQMLRDLNDELNRRGSWQRRFVLSLVDVRYSNETAVYNENKPDRIYTFSSPVARCSLADLLCGKQGSVSLDTKKQLFAQSLMGVQAIHKAGFIHRDLKPLNIAIVSAEADAPHAVIIDLDSAVTIPPDGSGYQPREKQCGTIGFLAPEIENAIYSPTYSKEVDFFSMGCVGYEMFIGSMPWLLGGTNIFASYAQNPRSHHYSAVQDQLAKFMEEWEKLESAPLGSCERTLGSFLFEFPTSRLKISDALVCPWLADAVRRIEDTERENASVGQKRKAS